VKPDLTIALDAATAAADAAQQVIEKYLSSGDWSVTFKSDDSPVTEVDVAAEKAISCILREAMPEAVFFGEETGKTAATEQAKLLWLVDPIDGTKSFVRNMPFYSTQIALAVDQSLSIGVSNAPAYKERLKAITGHGAWLNGTKVYSRQEIVRLEDAFLSSGNLNTLARDTSAWQRYGLLVSKVKRVRGYGDFCHYHQLCCGQTDIIVESDVNILDIAALTVAVRESGGVITDLHGAAIAQNTTSVLAAANKTLHSAALQLLSAA
jgi:histidinol-phosphatase